MSSVLDYFAQNHDLLLYSAAGVCLLLEMAVLGMSGPLLFIAVGCLLTGMLVTINVIGGWQAELISVAVLSVIAAVLLWRPLKKFQNSGTGADTSSDMIGKVLPVVDKITGKSGLVSYSGIDWQARLDRSSAEEIDQGASARVVAVNGSLLIVVCASN